MIKINNLSLRYSKGTLALDNISAEFPQEHILAILGESGSGKTTLLKLMGRFLKPTSGEILINNRNIRAINEKDLRENIGIVFQELYLFPHLSIMDNLILAPTKVFHADRNASKKQASEIMERLSISDLAESYPSQVSGGQAQRVAIARSLMMNPAYLLLDEPTAALDINTTNDFAQWLLELKTNTTFIVVTHDIPFARQVASSGIWLCNGKVTSEGNINHILDEINTTRKEPE